MGHVVLLGDSIFDNASYVRSGPSLIEHLRRGLPGGWDATLLAVDGSVASDVASQLGRLPDDASHLFASMGGNDALHYGRVIFREPADSFDEVMNRLGTMGEEFRRQYRAALQAVLDCGKPTTVCTIYDAIPGLGLSLRTGLCVFNDVITREAFRHGLPLIDLRLICNEAADYAPISPIEPSVAGGAKIAKAVIRAITEAGGTRVISS